MLALWVFVGGLALAWEAVALPASIYAAVLGARRFRKSEPGVGTTAIAQVRDALVGTGLALLAATAVRAAMWMSASWWWLLSGVAGAAAMLGAFQVLAIALRRGTGAQPLPRPALTAHLAALGARVCGHRVEVRECWADPSATGPSAVVTGLGRRGAVWLSRDMVRDWSDAEIAVVVAHEFSHHVHRDLWRKAALDGAVLSMSLWVADRVLAAWEPSGLNAWPLLAAVAWAVWWMARPVRLAQSRAHERRADRFALALTGHTEAFRSAIRRLGEHHLAEDRPSRLTRWWFHTHPTVAERLRAAEEERSQQLRIED